jgi:hypothetical protein
MTNLQKLRSKLTLGSKVVLREYGWLVEGKVMPSYSKNIDVLRYVVVVKKAYVELHRDINATEGSTLDFPTARELVSINDEGFAIQFNDGVYVRYTYA